MTRYEQIQARLLESPETWLVTGVAGFIGSHLLETLLKLNQRVVGLDNFATGYMRNLNEVQSLVSPEQWSNFHFIEGDIRRLVDCRKACAGVKYVLHQAALGSVPRSIVDPIATNDTNVTGFLNMLVAACEAKVKSFTYAASSSTYGDHQALPKVEENIGKPLSPYAVTKYVNELYAEVFARNFGLHTIGLRYFNVFGPRQDPNGAYAAVIPKWTAALLKGETVYINGDGETSRDFTYVVNAVQANLLAATAIAPDTSSDQRQSPMNQVYNVAVGERTTLNELFRLLCNCLEIHTKTSETSQIISQAKPKYVGFRQGDVHHSQADVCKAKRLLGYQPTHQCAKGLAEAVSWYFGQQSKA